MPSIGLFNPILGGANVEITQIRGRKRGKRNISRSEKLRLLQMKEERLARKKNSRHKSSLHRIGASHSALSWPPSYDAEAEKHLEDAPRFNVYFKDALKTHFYSLSEALEMHRSLQIPEIYGNKDALLKLRLELDMSTDRATKFIGSSRQLVSIPFTFPHKEKRTILAFAEDKPLQEEALEAGADLALGADAIKKILKGKFLIDDYDFCVAHQDMAQAILPLRGLLKSRMPTKNNGAIGQDLVAILKEFLAGVNLVVKPNSAQPQFGLSEPIVGRLNMPDEEVQANVERILAVLCQQRNPALGPYVKRALLMTVPGKAFYSVEISAWLPVPTEADLLKVEKRNKKKKKKPKEEEEEEEELRSRVDPVMERWTRADPLFHLM